jgi:hypothetical protein
MADDPTDFAKRLAVAQAVCREVNDLLNPLLVMMRAGRWRPEFRVIMWEAVMNRAKQLAEEAAKDAT